MTTRVLAMVLAFCEHVGQGVFVIEDDTVCALPRQWGSC